MTVREGLMALARNIQRSYFIKSSQTQAAILAYIVVSPFVTLSLARVTMIALYSERMRLPLPEPFNQLWILIIPTAAFFGLFWFGLVLSNRIAGPIYRIQRHMQEMIDGKPVPPTVHLRKKDYFQEVAQTYNELLKKIPVNHRQ